MVDLFIATDENDTDLGPFFSKCRVDLIDFLEAFQQHYIVTELGSNLCTEEYIEIALVKKMDVPFIFLTNTHGNEEGVLASRRHFVKVGGNNNAFRLSLFYANSCSAGLNLGPDLTNNYGCRSFIGYNQAVYTFLDENEKISIRCFNWGIKFFLSKEAATIKEAFNAMQTEYTNQIDKLFNNKEILKASLLLNNRNSLIIHGDLTLTADQLHQ